MRRPPVALRPMLPPDFRWRSVGTAPFEQPNSLLLDGTEVARLSRRIGEGTWYISLNNQREDRDLRKLVDCSGYEQGKAGAQIWAERHQTRLRAEVAQYLAGLKARRSVIGTVKTVPRTRIRRV